jgi:hypothetical protein
MREERENLIVLICEIYSTAFSTGGSIFSLGALPEEVRIRVKGVLLHRKLIDKDA